MKRTGRSAAAAALVALSSSSKPKLQSEPNKLTKKPKWDPPLSDEKNKSSGNKKTELTKTKSGTSKSKNKANIETNNEVSPYFPTNILIPSLIPASKFVANPSNSKLSRAFFDQDCENLCKALLGTVLVRRIPDTGEILKGTIVETEAYPGGTDRASQSYQGKRTPRNEAMFLDPGTAYVYFTYGMYFCFNISSKEEGAACLLRAVEPLEEYETMHKFRQPNKKKNQSDLETLKEDSDNKPKKRLKVHELANGPSKLCLAFGINRENCDKIDMTINDELWLEPSKDMRYLNREFEIEASKRIGIDSTPPEARNRLLRFYIKDSLCESRAKVSEIKKRLGI